MRTRFACCAVAWVVAVPLVVFAQTSAVQEFNAGDGAMKKRVLDGLAKRHLSTSPQELTALVSSSLSDGDPEIRRRGLSVIVAHAGAPRFARGNTAVMAKWAEDHQAIQQLKPLVTKATHDNSAIVRRAAILALGNMEYRPDGPLNNMNLSASFVTTLAAMYRGEPDAAVRSEIVKSLALSTNDTPAIRRVFEAGFSDQSASVRQYAALGAGRVKDDDFVYPLVMAS